MNEIANAVQSFSHSQFALQIGSTIFTTLLSAIVALVTYHLKSRKHINGAITWQWVNYAGSSENEEPFVSIENRSDIPEYVVRLRLLRGNFFRIESSPNALAYIEFRDGNFPIEIKPKSIRSLPISMYQADVSLKKANIINKIIGYLFKRNYLWIEVSMMSRRCLMIPANDSCNYRDRPLWVSLRWFRSRRRHWEQQYHQFEQEKKDGH